jgi:hypothetical protein
MVYHKTKKPPSLVGGSLYSKRDLYSYSYFGGTAWETAHYFNFVYDCDEYLLWFSNIAKRISFSFMSLLNESHSGLNIFISHSPIRVLFGFKKFIKQLILQQYSSEM